MAINKNDLPIIPECIPTKQGKFSSFIGLSVLNLLGWTIVGKLPHKPKFVVAVAPHTSNWDFVIAIAAMLAMKLKIRFMGKSSLFIWPFNIILNNWGGIPINRDAKHGVVEQMVEQFKQNEQLVLGIAPEGTRSKTSNWKSGFLHIAHQANVPVVPASLDFAKKQLKFHPAVEISSDIDKELMNIKAHYADICAKNPQAV